jgi:PAS domain S-box-containing protein
MEKSDYDLFPQHEANIFLQQENFVFQTQQPQEHEEEFTDIHGKTHLIATKRALNKDAAGNFFLVGVLRDITQRKQIEE